MTTPHARPLVAIAVAIIVTSAPAILSGTTDGAGAAAAAPLTQTFVGGGSGTIFTMPRFFPSFEGRYTSSSQLGTGQFGFGGDAFTADFTRSDGMLMDGTFANSTECDHVFVAADECFAADLTGSRDIASAHIVIVEQASSPTQFSFLMRGTLTLRRRVGYSMVGADGTTYAFGGIDHLGDAHTTHATDLERTPSGKGEWVVNAAGQVYAFGDARYLGNANAATFSAREVVTSMSATPTGRGYWLFTSRGRALAFGDAHLYGDLHTVSLNGPIIGSVATSTGRGYYMVGNDGGVFAFGDARFRGSMGGVKLNRPVVGLVPTADNSGYWLVASDGGVFAFHAPFHGSMGGTRLNRPIVAMVPYGHAYLMFSGDGGAFTFSGSTFFGSLGGIAIPAAIVDGAAIG